MALVGMTKQGVRNLNHLGPKRKKPEVAVAELTEGEAQPIQAPPQPVPEVPTAATEVPR